VKLYFEIQRNARPTKSFILAFSLEIKFLAFFIFIIHSHIKRRISASYDSIVSAKLRFNRRYLSTLYNTVALLHILYIAPFKNVLTHVDKFKIRSTFFRFAKYLLRYPIWTRNLKLINRLPIENPTKAVVKLIEKHNQKISNHAWKQLLLH
jgi:hypothetical protein